MLVKDVGQIPYHLENEFGIESTIIGYKEDLTYSYLDNQVKGLNIQFLPHKGSFKYFEISFIEYLFSNARKIDVLNLYHYQPETFIYGLLYKVLNPSGLLYVKLDHDLRSLYLHKTLYYTSNKVAHFFFGFLKFFFKRVVNLVSIETKEGKELIERYYPALRNKIVLIPNGLDLEQVKKDFNFEKPNTERENRIITIGRIGTKQKNTEMLMEAATKLKLRDWEIDIVGGYDDEFSFVIDEYFKANPHLKGRVNFYGNVVDRKKVYRMLERSRIFCLTSRWESFGFVLIEAFLAGCYIISTEFASVKDIVPNASVGKITPQKDLDAFISAIQEVIDNSEGYVVEREDNIKIVQEVYNWKHIVKNLFVALEEKGLKKKLPHVIKND